MNLRRAGFTLIELSVVLVIIGLLIGAVLAGRDLIQSAAARGTVAQVEKYQSAVGAFQEKFNALPGDINATAAAQFGFTTRGPYAGEGDGNGLIEGIATNASGQNSGSYTSGEATTFWVDMSTANGLNLNMIDGSFSTASPAVVPGTISGTALNNYLPQAKIGEGNYIYVWSQGFSAGSTSTSTDSYNYFGLSLVSSITNGYQIQGVSGNSSYTGSGGLTPKQAYAIDSKIDDGQPTTGVVTAQYQDTGQAWSYLPGNGSAPSRGVAPTAAITGTSSSCFDNGGSSGTTLYYSVKYNGNNANCGLSFQFQNN